MAQSAEYYNTVHRTWERFHGAGSPTYQLRRRLVRPVIAQCLRPGDAALDFGCGTGDYLELLRACGATVDGVDFSEYALDIARKRYGGDSSITLHQGDLYTFTPKRRYQCILISEVLEHVEDDAGLLRRTREWLVPGGRVIITVPFDPQLWSYSDELSGHVRRYTKASMATLVQRAGMRTVTQRYYGFPLLWTYWRATRRWRKQVSEMSVSKPGTMAARAARFLGKAAVFDLLFTRLPIGVGVITVVTPS